MGYVTIKPSDDVHPVYHQNHKFTVLPINDLRLNCRTKSRRIVVYAVAANVTISIIHVPDIGRSTVETVLFN